MSNSWFVCFRPNTKAVLRLFCFPYAGGGASIFRGWPEGLPNTVEVYSVEFPGRGNRLLEPPFIRLFPLVHEMAKVLVPHLDKPFAFFGHSLGALISFELARHLLSRYNRHPVHLFVSGRCAPQIPDPDPPIHHLSQPEFVEELRKLNGTPNDVLKHPELMNMLMPVLRADFEICETYVYSGNGRLNCPISAFGGLGDSEVLRENLEGWKTQTSSTFTLRMFPGDHFFLHTAESFLLQELSRNLSNLATRPMQSL